MAKRSSALFAHLSGGLAGRGRKAAEEPSKEDPEAEEEKNDDAAETPEEEKSAADPAPDDDEEAEGDGGTKAEEDDDMEPSATDGEEEEASTSARRARRRERMRVARILNHPAAARNTALAARLAPAVDMPVMSSAAAVSVLEAAGPGEGRAAAGFRALAADRQQGGAPALGPNGAVERKRTSGLSAAVDADIAALTAKRG